MNEFSMICRILGTLYQRSPADELVKPLLALIENGNLKAAWPLEQDALWDRMKKAVECSVIADDYQQLFNQTNPAVEFRAENYQVGAESAIREFLVERGMPIGEAPVDTFGGLLLAASWLEDQAAEDETAAQIQFFDEFILSWSDDFLGKVEAHAQTAFYRTLAEMTREALAALFEELNEISEQDELNK